ncbi:MAG: ABC transporter substrate-binding protein [Flavipsychrobacter sp.]|nr:ABC transporter substrate-binding protein [Flavipsychrobacter sp.]
MSRMITDMTGRQFLLPEVPKRIVSLVPSQTELLYDLGLDEEVVGITKFCVHPEPWFRSKRRVGGTKTVHRHIIDELQPDLIIANKEENTKEQIEELASVYPVWISDIKTVAHALQMIELVGIITGREVAATELVHEIAGGFAGLPTASQQRRVAYYIWKDPWMCAGGDTFISDVITKMGWQNVCEHLPRYPEVNLQDLHALQPDLVLLSSEPYPFKDKHIAEITAAVPGAEVKLVDGEMFSWYGSRMRHAITYLRELATSQH